MEKYLKFKDSLLKDRIKSDITVTMVVSNLFRANENKVCSKLKWYIDTYDAIKIGDESISQTELKAFFEIHIKAVEEINKGEIINIDFIFNNKFMNELRENNFN